MSPEKEPHVGRATLDWNGDRGFVLHLTAEGEGVRIQLHEIPVPADGTDELAAGVDLDKLDVLFKADADVEGAPGQVLEASLQAGDTELTIRAKVEEAESGGISSVEFTIPLDMHGNPPVSGGPRPAPQSEDELDWEDETTFEKLFSDVFPKGPAGAPGNKGDAPGEKGLSALLKALAETDEPEEEEDDDDDLYDEAPDLGGLDVEGLSEAGELLNLLIEQEHLLLEGDAEVGDLASVVAEVLSSGKSAEAKAEALSQALINAPSVEDLFIDDEALERLLERW
ncbi:MAG: hypothetical protein JXX28_09695 [Deltaproteobacteria bacterium]|nr:hypothetical protein [Deltaproteobacteria bacterium]